MSGKRSARSEGKKRSQITEEKELNEMENTETVNSSPEVNEELEALKKEMETQKDQFLRMAAEYDNFRKRTEKEKAATYDNAVAATVEAFLPVADNFALAMASDAKASDDFRAGLEMIEKQLASAFEKLRVTAFGERGDEFDPNLHNAVSRVDDPELPEDHITAVYQKGYLIGDRIIRHAMVQISN